MSPRLRRGGLVKLLDVDWHGFGRTLGGFVDPWGRCAVEVLRA